MNIYAPHLHNNLKLPFLIIIIIALFVLDLFMMECGAHCGGPLVFYLVRFHCITACQGLVGVNICRRSQLFGLKSIEVEVVVAEEVDVDEEGDEDEEGEEEVDEDEEVDVDEEDRGDVDEEGDEDMIICRRSPLLASNLLPTP